MDATGFLQLLRIFTARLVGDILVDYKIDTCWMLLSHRWLIHVLTLCDP
jgi:hypothetical protein